MDEAMKSALYGQMALSLIWWNANVFRPALYLKKLGLYMPASLGPRPLAGAPIGGGADLSRRGQEPRYLASEPEGYESVKEFDHVADGYDLYVRSFSDPIVAETIALMRPFLAPDARVLDPSCGPGNAAIELSKVVPQGEVIAADLSRGMVDTAHRNALGAGRANVVHYQADVVNPPAEFEGYFDAIFCCLSFHHYPDGAGAARAFRKVLAPHGKVFVADPGPAWFIELAKTISQYADPGFVQHRTGEDFQKLFSAAGFSSVYWVEALPGIGVTIASV